MMRLRLTNAAAGKFPSASKIGISPPGIVSVCRQNMDTSLIQHTLRPVLRRGAKRASQGSGSNLHPDTSAGEPLNCCIPRIDPAQAFRVREYR